MSLRVSLIYVLIFASLIFVLVGLGAAGQQVIEEDDFTGTDGDPVDPNIWTEVNTGGGDYNRIESNTLRMKQTNGWGGIQQKNNFTANKFTVLIDWKPRSTSGRMFTLAVQTKVGNDMELAFAILYDHYWGWHISYRKGGTSQPVYVSWVNNARTDTWFTINITIWDGNANITITDRDTGTGKFSRTNWAIDPLNGVNRFRMSISSDVYHDNYKLYNLSLPPNEAPIWGPVPTLTAVEDVPITYNFSANVSDVDNVLKDLSISTVSQFVLWTNGLEAQFLFPNGITETTVYLVLTDGFAQVPKGVEFNITPVNDPPVHSIPEQMLAREDTPLFIDLVPYVWDVDDPISELYIEVDSQYVTAGRLNMTATFPEAVLEHELTFNLTDGDLSLPVTITFVIAAVDDPPVVSPLGEFEPVEDEVSVFNITSFLFDIDTPVKDLLLIVRAPNCTVVGHELHFLYTLGDIREEVLVQVTDGTSMVDAILVVNVSARNDGPVAHTVPPKLAVEDEPTTVDVWAYVEDEDTPKEQLSIDCDHPSVIGVSGFNITLLYPIWWSEHRVNYTVSDGYLFSQGHFFVQVQEVNDPPRIVGIGDLVPPVELQMDEATELWLNILVEDEDSNSFSYTIETPWRGLTVFTNGTLRVIAAWGEVGEYTATLSVDDRVGGVDTLDIAITVVNVNDPPNTPVIMDPNNHTTVEEGVNITFSVDVLDPDTQFGQVLTITWVSNLSGVMMTHTSGDELTFITDALPVGVHKVTVTVSDGTFERSAWIKLTILEPYVPPPPPEEEPNLLTEPTGILTILIVVILVVVVVAWMMARSRSQQREEVQAEAPVPTDLSVEVEDDPEVALAALSQELGQMATELEGHREMEKAQAPPPAPLETAIVPTVGVVKEISAEEKADREHATRVRDVGKALTQLPRGLPTTLGNKDLSQLARDIVDGPKRTGPDGSPLVQVDGRWYNMDHTNVGTFLQEHKDADGSRTSGGDTDRATKLEQLETRLLEGKISEETYDRLRKKYED